MDEEEISEIEAEDENVTKDKVLISTKEFFKHCKNIFFNLKGWKTKIWVMICRSNIVLQINFILDFAC